jgi:hypothetical protein
MKFLSLDTADRLYSQDTVLHLVNFTDRKLRTLVEEISRLLRSLGDQKELSVWPSIIQELKKTRFELATLPLPPEKIITGGLITQLKEVLTICRASFPDNLEQLSRIVDLLIGLQYRENQFMNWIRTECLKNKEQETCLCLLRSRYLKIIENFIFADKFLSRLKLKVTSPHDLKESTFFDRIFFCGSINLFSENQFRNFEHVWRSPRAPDLYFFSYDWIRDAFEPKPSFDIEPNMVPVYINKVNVEAYSNEEKRSFHKTEEVKYNPNEIDFSPVELFSSRSSTTGAGHYEAICESRLLALEDGTAIYKEIGRSSRIVEFSAQAVIIKIQNIELETGMPLIVRTEGSGDSIAAVADMLFGEKADEIRSKQEKWKIAFRRKLFTYSSVYDVARVLTSLGAPTANETNVRNWQRNDTIKPHEKDDFKAIMAFAELDEMCSEYWENARKIDLMHKRAGKDISSLLLGKINNYSRVEFEKYGRIDVELNGLSGKISVIRIESILPNTYKVPSSYLNNNNVLSIEVKSKWQE